MAAYQMWRVHATHFELQKPIHLSPDGPVPSDISVNRLDTGLIFHIFYNNKEGN